MLFLKEFCVFSQTLQQQNRDNFFQALSTHGILNVIQLMLVSARAPFAHHHPRLFNLEPGRHHHEASGTGHLHIYRRMQSVDRARIHAARDPVDPGRR